MRPSSAGLDFADCWNNKEACWCSSIAIICVVAKEIVTFSFQAQAQGENTVNDFDDGVAGKPKETHHVSHACRMNRVATAQDGGTPQWESYGTCTLEVTQTLSIVINIGSSRSIYTATKVLEEG